MPQPPDPNIFQKHNHRSCRSSGMKEARAFCKAQGLRLTPVRARVLEILLESHKALGAYDILARLKEDNLGSQPPVVYRALEFLVGNGFAHKLERLNAFAACCQPDAAHEPMFLICQNCRKVAETPLQPIGREIDRAAADLGFAVVSRMVEVTGTCPTCQAGT
ncbi:MAG: transcriptional repressor [Alphaproteobacteria bacterium]|nr:transcriptional repressor [Alphaproteobacteria bacterium]